MAPREESLRQTGEWLVVSVTPDVCMTPVGGVPVPVPYTIISRGLNAATLASKTNFTAQPVFHFGSHLQRVLGDEPGVLGGVLSGVNCGVCYPVSGSPTVNIEGFPLLRHDDPFGMNAASYGAPYNTVGFAVWVETPDTSDGEPWYIKAIEKAKKKLDSINQDFKQAEQKFGESLKKAYSTDPRAMNQPLGEAASQFAGTVKERLQGIAGLPGRIAEAPPKYLEDLVTGVAKGVPEAAGNFLDSMASGDIGKAFGNVAFDVAGGALGDKALSRNAHAEIGKAQGRVNDAKGKVRAGQEPLQSTNKSLKKLGGRIQGSPGKRAAKKARRDQLMKQREKLQAADKNNLNKLDQAKSALDKAKANPNSYDYGKLIDLSDKSTECVNGSVTGTGADRVINICINGVK